MNGEITGKFKLVETKENQGRLNYGSECSLFSSDSLIDSTSDNTDEEEAWVSSSRLKKKNPWKTWDRKNAEKREIKKTLGN